MSDYTNDDLRRMLEEATDGPWIVADGCSWRRILQYDGVGKVLVPTTSATDGHPDLFGDATYPNLTLAAAAPDLARLLIEEREAHAETRATADLRADTLAYVLDRTGRGTLTALLANYLSLQDACKALTAELAETRARLAAEMGQEWEGMPEGWAGDVRGWRKRHRLLWCEVRPFTAITRAGAFSPSTRASIEDEEGAFVVLPDGTRCEAFTDCRKSGIELVESWIRALSEAPND